MNSLDTKICGLVMGMVGMLLFVFLIVVIWALIIGKDPTTRNQIIIDTKNIKILSNEIQGE